MEQISENDYTDFYDSISNRVSGYSKLHIRLLKLLWPSIKDYHELYSSEKNVLPYKTFTFEEADNITGISGSVLHAILNDLTKDNLLFFQPYMPGANWTVTELGYICIPKMIK